MTPSHAWSNGTYFDQTWGKAMIRCIKFRAFQKNTLKAFVDLELSRVGIVIRDCTWHEKNGKEWVGFPARSYTDKDGNPQWQALVEFAAGAKEEREQFQARALEAIRDVVAEQSR